MNTRLNPFGTQLGPKFGRQLVSADKAIAGSTLPTATAELIRIRASQINGCGGCLDMHVKEAAHAGESAVRLGLIAAWRETTVFTDAERAALELTEEGTRLADSRGISDDTWANAAKHYDEEELMAIVALISLINAFNRLMVITQQQGGTYEVGQLATVKL
ncbi:carboxymuconolactone decarboxylase family protein [Kribbella sp. NPDC055071]